MAEVKEKDAYMKKHIWELFSDEHLRLWPTGDKVTFFSDKSSVEMPKRLIGREGNIRAPKPLPVDPLIKRGIALSGFSEHGAGYYHSRINEEYIDMIFIAGGEYGVKYGDIRTKIGPHETLIIPPGQLCDTYVDGRSCRVGWMHFKKNSQWKDIFGPKIFMKRMSGSAEIIAIMNLYMGEVFSKTRSLKMLEILAETLELALKREFAPADPSRKDPMSELEAQIENSLEAPWTAEQTAKRLDISVKTLNEKFKKIHSMNFSKFVLRLRMQKALELMKNGADNAEAARKLGYCDAFSFSKAFKSFYGTSPKNYF